MTNSARHLSDDDPKVLEAAHWLLRLSDEGACGEDVTAWQRWLSASPTHRIAFERAQSVWQLASRLNRVPWPTDREVAEDSYDASIPVSRASHSRKRPWRTLAMAAAIAIMTIGAAAFLLARQSASLLATDIGESRSMTLSDGSRVTLGGASRLQFVINEHSRSLDLRSGEAFFEVAQDSRRPFVVRAGDARITAIGTAFNVRRAADRVQVAVTDGTVKVMETQVDAGRQAVVVGGEVMAPTPAEVPVVLARKAGRLQYTSEPLRYVVADLGRYSHLPIEIKGVPAGELLITGTVLENDLEGWLHGLEKALPVTVTFTEQRIVIMARYESPNSVGK